MLHGNLAPWLLFWSNCTSEKQNREGSYGEVYETATLVRHETTEISSYNALPPLSIQPIKLLH